MTAQELELVDQIVAKAEGIWRCLLWSYAINAALLVGLIVEIHGG